MLELILWLTEWWVESFGTRIFHVHCIEFLMEIPSERINIIYSIKGTEFLHVCKYLISSFNSYIFPTFMLFCDANEIFSVSVISWVLLSFVIEHFYELCVLVDYFNFLHSLSVTSKQCDTSLYTSYSFSLTRYTSEQC